MATSLLWPEKLSKSLWPEIPYHRHLSSCPKPWGWAQSLLKELTGQPVVMLEGNIHGSSIVLGSLKETWDLLAMRINGLDQEV